MHPGHMTVRTPKVNMSILQAAPSGFASAVETLNLLPQDILAELCHEVLQFLQYKVGVVNTDLFHQRTESVDLCLSVKSIQAAVNALTHLFRNAARLELTSEQLDQELRGSLSWNSAAISVLTHAWKEQGNLLTASDQAKQLLNIGQLEDLQWKLGVAMSSDSCKNLNSPFVSMTVKVADPSGEVITRSFEMSIPEFQDFSRQLRDMASVLETV